MTKSNLFRIEDSRTNRNNIDDKTEQGKQNAECRNTQVLAQSLRHKCALSDTDYVRQTDLKRMTFDNAMN